MNKNNEFKPGYKLWFVKHGTLSFVWGETKNSLLISGSEEKPEIIVDSTGVNDSPECLASCLDHLLRRGALHSLLEKGKRSLRLATLGSLCLPDDSEALAYSGSCPGTMTITATTHDGRVVKVDESIVYY